MQTIKSMIMLNIHAMESDSNGGFPLLVLHRPPMYYALRFLQRIDLWNWRMRYMFRQITHSVLIAADEKSSMSVSETGKIYKIGDVTELLGLSADTLRYYEKIGLLPRVSRTASGIRQYDDRDISRLNFIRRAQKMNFSLNEIAGLLKMRDDPQHAREEVRQMTVLKLKEVESHLEELSTLRTELQLLLNLCQGSVAGCPIIEGIESETEAD